MPIIPAELPKNISDFIQSHPILWFSLFTILFLLSLLNWLSKVIPQIDIIRAKLLLPLAHIYKQKKLIKSAIKSDIEGHVNDELLKLKPYLPADWASGLNINWVDCNNPTVSSSADKIIVRIRPVDNQDQNFVNATNIYLRTSFFPKTQNVIPKQHYEATILYTGYKIAKRRGSSAKTIFEDNILEPAIKKYKRIPQYFEDYDFLNKRGLLTGTFLRELHSTASESRFTTARNNMGAETNGILTHIKNFVQFLEKDGKVPPTHWQHCGDASQYAILLVANPTKATGRIDPYINRAREKFQTGAKRLYIFGTNPEARFANAVMVGIEGTIENIRLVERFRTPYDYRGQKNGLGAIFEKN